MTTLTTGHVNALFRQLVDHDFQRLEHDLIRAVERNNVGTAQRDGFPSGRPGSGGDDAGTSVESAALANLDDTTLHDSLHQHVQAAVDRLWAAVADLEGLERRLELIGKLAAPDAAYDPSGYCAACDRWVPGTSADRLRSGYCEKHYRAWLRDGRPHDRAEWERDRRRAERNDPQAAAS